MGKTYTLRFSSSDLGQILDGLRCRVDSWRGTAEYLATGVTPRGDFVIEECSDADEARALADDYERIIGTIESQRNAQRNEP